MYRLKDYNRRIFRLSNYSCMLISSKWSRISLKSRPLDTVSLRGDGKPFESRGQREFPRNPSSRNIYFPIRRLGNVPPDKLTYLSDSRCIELIRQSITFRSKIFPLCFAIRTICCSTQVNDVRTTNHINKLMESIVEIVAESVPFFSSF